MNTEQEFGFILDDVYEWLACSDEADRKVWMGSYLTREEKKEFAKKNPSISIETSFIDVAKDKAVSKMKFLIATVIKKRSETSETDTKEPEKPLILYLPSFSKQETNDIEHATIDLLIRHAKKMKAEWEKKESSFKDVGHFVNSVVKSVAHRLVDFVFKTNVTGSLDEPLTEEESRDLSDLIEVDIFGASGSVHTSIEEALDKATRMDRANKLLDAFVSSGLLTNANRKHLSFLRSIERPGSPIMVIEYLKNKKEEGLQTAFNEHRRKNSPDLSENTWLSNNRRTRKGWGEFLDTSEGKKLFEDFRERGPVKKELQ